VQEVDAAGALGGGIGFDGRPAEGNPSWDDSALVVLDAGTGEEVASLAGKFQPAVLAIRRSWLFAGLPVG
jgi:hypothetical protein